MRRSILALSLAMALAAIPGAPDAGVRIGVKGMEKSAKPRGIKMGDPVDWTGKWAAESGSKITISSENGFLDIAGEDAHSKFSVTCIVEDVTNRNRAVCVGQGVNSGPAIRFLYRSTMVFDDEGNIVEEWKADFWDPGSNSRGDADGKDVYKRVPAETE